MTYKDLKTENEKLKESLQTQLLANLTLLDEIKNLKELDNKDIKKLKKEIKRKNRIISYLESKCLKGFE